MRIRKRLAPSSIPKAGLSDLQLLGRSEAAAPSDQSSDQSTAICGKNNTWAFLAHDKNQEKTEQKEEFYENGTWEIEEKNMKSTINNDIRKIVSICHHGEEEGTNKIMLPSSSNQGWCAEDYKVVPPKKRKGCFERNPNEELTSLVSAKMKSKTNKKCGDHILYNMQLNQESAIMEEKNVTNTISWSMNGGVKKCKRANVIMEGSRCSRVNGRGWRCHQPTMVGYSLCEHHLGKGRLRTNMAGAQVRRGGDVAAGGGAPTPLPPPSGGGLNEEEVLMVRKKRTKVGVVKARSMSSLLSQI